MTEDLEGVEEDEFHEGLQQAMDEAPRRDVKRMMGDFNA